MSSSPGTHTTCNCKSASQADAVHNGNEKAVGAQVDEKKDTEAEPDITSWSFPTPEAIREELSKEFSNEQKEKVWTECAEAVKTSYDQLLGRWKEEMDTLLVYAGVSSAVLTAFNVESYHLLQPDPTDPTLAVLKQISAQLNGYTFTPPFMNATHTARPGDFIQAPFQAPASAIWLNSLWFSSLVFSFASALLALFVKQWIYEALVPGTSHESSRLRQYRYNGLLKWRVGTVVVVLPILLQLASVLFLAGLLVLLWTLHRTVAAIISLLVALVFAFSLSVTILPVLKSGCSYRSPASFAIYTVLRYTRNEALRAIRQCCKVIYGWSMQWPACIGQPHFDRLGEFAYTAFDNMPTWRGRDKNAIYEDLGALDRAIVTTAYITTADSKYLSYMPVIFSDLPSNQVGRCFADLLDFMQAEWGHWHLPESHGDPVTLPLCASYGLRYMLARSDKGTAAWNLDVEVVFSHFFIGTGITERLAELACKSLCHLGVEYQAYRHLSGLAYTTLKDMYEEQGARHTFDTLCHVKALYEAQMAAWDPSVGFASFRDTTQAIYVLLHCIRATMSGQSQLSPSQADALLAWGRDELARLHRWLCDLEWGGLHRGCLSIPGDTAAILTFPHVASDVLGRDIVDPLLALVSLPRGLTIVSGELVSAVESSWSVARLAYPQSADPDAPYLWCSGLDSIDTRLAQLRAAISTHPVTLSS